MSRWNTAKHGVTVSGQKTEKEEKKMARYLASIEFGNTQVFHEEGDNLNSLLFELGKRALDYVFDASEMSKEVAMYSIYDFEKRDNVYFSVLHNVKGSIEEISEKPPMSRWKLRRNRLTADGPQSLQIITGATPEKRQEGLYYAKNGSWNKVYVRQINAC